jgi:hypothetical protein
MRRTVVLLAVLAVSLPGAARAAEEGKPGKDSDKAPKYEEVERGAWIGSDIGAIFYFSVPGEGGAFSNGTLIGFEAGYDLTPDLQAGLVGWGQSVGADATYKGIDDTEVDPKRARGDFHSLLAGASARYSFLKLRDENEVERTHLYLRVSGGMAMSRPIGVLDDSGFFVLGGPGVEYFTRLRHFSVGIELDGVATIVGSGTAVGAAVLPHLKYSF